MGQVWFVNKKRQNRGEQTTIPNLCSATAHLSEYQTRMISVLFLASILPAYQSLINSVDYYRLFRDNFYIFFRFRMGKARFDQLSFLLLWVVFFAVA